MAQEDDKENEQSIFLCEQSFERRRDKVLQDREGVLSGHLCLSKVEALFLSPLDPLGNKVSSYKSPPSLAFSNWKSGPIVGVAFLIRYRPNDPQGYQKLGHSRLANPILGRRRMLFE